MPHLRTAPPLPGTPRLLLLGATLLIWSTACSTCIRRDGLTPKAWEAREHAREEALFPVVRDSFDSAFPRVSREETPRDARLRLLGVREEGFSLGGKYGFDGPKYGNACSGYSIPSEVSVARNQWWLTADRLVVLRTRVGSHWFHSAHGSRPPYALARKEYRLTEVSRVHVIQRSPSIRNAVIDVETRNLTFMLTIAPEDSALAASVVAELQAHGASTRR